MRSAEIIKFNHVRSLCASFNLAGIHVITIYILKACVRLVYKVYINDSVLSKVLFCFSVTV